MEKYTLIFDKVILNQLKKAGKNTKIKEILSKMFNKIESDGPNAGKLLDSKLFIYEMKNMHPPIRLYFKHKIDSNEMYLFEFEMKTSQIKQQKTIEKIGRKSLESEV